LYEVKAQRRQVTESIDDIVAQVPKLKPEDVTAAYDWHARRLREIDLVIQQANHATVVEVGDTVMDDFKTPSK
jgi:3-methyladenine DNA glycosylase AlkC